MNHSSTKSRFNQAEFKLQRAYEIFFVACNIHQRIFIRNKLRKIFALSHILGFSPIIHHPYRCLVYSNNLMTKLLNSQHAISAWKLLQLQHCVIVVNSSILYNFLHVANSIFEFQQISTLSRNWIIYGSLALEMATDFSHSIASNLLKSCEQRAFTARMAELKFSNEIAEASKGKARKKGLHKSKLNSGSWDFGNLSAMKWKNVK